AGGAVPVDELLLLQLGALVFLFLLAALLFAGLRRAALGLGRWAGVGIARGERRAEENRKAEQHGCGEGAEAAGAAVGPGVLRFVCRMIIPHADVVETSRDRDRVAGRCRPLRPHCRTGGFCEGGSMSALRILAVPLLLVSMNAALADDVTDALDAARKAYQAGDFAAAKQSADLASQLIGQKNAEGFASLLPAALS